MIAIINEMKEQEVNKSNSGIVYCQKQTKARAVKANS